ncbi:MAG: sigma-70 family RNA polymerase sigma factor, partial [Planctomycetota bacterium]|nr:sigma-70 family RNA polymerase sigma factor [Planctomycetota bacterium]
VREYGPLVWKTAYRLLPSEADAADCFQETFISAMEASCRSPVRHWAGLLQRLAIARALDLLRRRHRQRSEGLLDRNQPDGSAASDPVARAVAVEVGEQLRDAVGQLPNRESEVFCLRFLSELSYQEISVQLEMSIDAVGVALHRARARLRELLSGVGVVEQKQR